MQIFHIILSEIGTHAYPLLRYVTNLEVKEISAEVNSLSPELSVDDNYQVIQDNDNFLWIGRGYPYRWLIFCIHRCFYGNYLHHMRIVL